MGGGPFWGGPGGNPPGKNYKVPISFTFYGVFTGQASLLYYRLGVAQKTTFETLVLKFQAFLQFRRLLVIPMLYPLSAHPNFCNV